MILDGSFYRIHMHIQNLTWKLNLQSTWGHGVECSIQGDGCQVLSDPSYNSAIPDMYPYLCLVNNNEERTFTAAEYVEVMSTFDSERDYDFNWKRFDVGTSALPEFTSILMPALVILGALGMAVVMTKK